MKSIRGVHKELPEVGDAPPDYLRRSPKDVRRVPQEQYQDIFTKIKGLLNKNIADPEKPGLDFLRVPKDSLVIFVKRF